MAQTLIVAVWVASNLILAVLYFKDHPSDCVVMTNGVRTIAPLSGCQGAHPYDFYPFVLLNLCFSVLAAYAAPVILYAQNSQQTRDKAALEEARAIDKEQQEEISFIARELADIRAQLNRSLTRTYTEEALGRLRTQTSRPPRE